MQVDASAEGEEAEIRRCIREAIFKDREARRMYFSQKRIGTGVGVPPARLELTEEFKRAGKAPPSQPPRPVSGEQRAAQREYEEDLIAQGKLQPSTSPFGAAVVMVRKPKGGWRMALDYREVNEVLVKQHYSLKGVSI